MIELNHDFNDSHWKTTESRYEETLFAILRLLNHATKEYFMQDRFQ
jgi:hypothetical protein